MKWMTIVAVALGLLASCATKKERKAVPPQSSASDMPWATPEPGSSGGAMGALLDPSRR